MDGYDEEFKAWDKRRLLALALDLGLKGVRTIPLSVLRERVYRKFGYKGTGKPACFGDLYNIDLGDYPRSRLNPCRKCTVAGDCRERMGRETEKILRTRARMDAAPYYKFRGRRLKRNLALASRLKVLYGYRCQMCRARFLTRDGHFLIHAHHIRPLSRTGQKGDVAENIVVICPNHHLLLDLASSARVDWSARTMTYDKVRVRLRLFDPRHISASRAPA